MAGLSERIKVWLDRRATFPEGSDGYWRERILHGVILVGMIIGAVVFVPSIWFLVTIGKVGVAVVDAVVYAAFLVITISRRPSYKLRAWFVCLAVYGLGAMLYARLGPYSVGPVWLFTFPIVAGVLLDMRAAALAIVLNTLTLATIGALMFLGAPLGWLPELKGEVQRWVVYTINLLFINGVATVAATYLLHVIGRSNQRLAATLDQLREQMRLRQEAEQRLAASEDRLGKIIRESQAGYFFIDRQGLFQEVNQAWLDMHGYTDQAEVIGRHFRLTQVDQNRQAAQAIVDHLLESRTVPPGVFSRRRKDGGVGYHTYSVNRVVRGGEVVGLEGFLIDITDKRLAEIALGESEAKFKALYDSMTELSVLHELVRDEHGAVVDYRITDCNRSFSQITGISREQALGALASQLYGVTPPPYLDIYARTAQTGQPHSFETYFAPMGKHFNISVFSPGPDSFATIATDITERKRAGEALRQSEEKFRLAFSTSPDAICITRASDGVFLEVNDGFHRILGYSREELTDQTSLAMNIYEDSEDRRRILEILWSQGSVSNFETQFRRKDGGLVTGLMSAVIFKLNGEPCILSITRDIDQLRRAEAEKSKLADQLRQAQKMEAIGTLAGGIAHDFNNILGAVLGFAEMARIDAEAGQVNPGDLDQIIGSAQRAKELVQRILAFSRKQEPNLQPLNLNLVVERTRTILERTLPKMIRIVGSLEADLPLVEADPTQMEQVLLNLASNAKDAMPDGGELSFATQRVFLDQDYCRRHLEVRPGAYVLLAVSDNGKGMDEATRERIFEPFFTTKGVGQGTGLGLASTFGIIKSHGGHIHCYSELGLGSTFRLYLPVLRLRVPLAGGHPADAAEAEAPGGNETILLVDDEETLLRFGARALEGKGYRVLTAGNGEDALRTYRDRMAEIDLVVMDLGMPGMGGHRALEALLSLNPAAKVIIASGYAADGQMKASLEAGAAGFVAKPFRRRDLLLSVRQVLDRDPH